MKHTTKLLMLVVVVTLFLCLALPVVAATNTEGVTFSATIDTPVIEVSDQEQTVTVTITTNKEVVYDSYEADVYLPDSFVIAEMKNTATTFVEEADYFGTLIVYCTSNAKNLTTDNLLTITYTIPANTPAGEYELGVYFWIIGRDYCTDIWEEGADVSATLTITEAPSCNHTNTTAVPNGNGTHKVVCECGETVSESENCSGGTATCTDKAVCKDCNTAYGTTLEHSFNNKASNELKSAANCVVPELRYVQCDNCDEVNYEMSVAVGETDSHTHYNGNTPSYYKDNGNGTHTGYCGPCGNPIAGTDGDHDKATVQFAGNCQQPAWYTCSVCRQTYQGATNPSVHAATSVGYKDATATTHTVYHPCCDEPIETVSHDFNNADHKCACGKVETFTLTILVLATDDVVELTVEYGANLLDVLAQASAEGKIPVIGDRFRVNNDSYNGEVEILGYSYYVSDEWGYQSIADDFTMPGNALEIEQDYIVYGWYFDDNGTMYFDETGYCWLVGWQFIEEDYDGVAGGAWYYFNNSLYRVTGLVRVPYPTVEINGITYAPNAADKAYWEAHKDTSKYSDATTAVFVFGADGKFIQDTGLVDNGTRYAVNGCVAWHVGMVKVGNDYYYFGGDKVNGGNIMLTGKVYATRDFNSGLPMNGTTYDITDDGKVIVVDKDTTGIVKVGDKSYYYVDGKLAKGAGVVALSDENGTFYIYVKSNGELATGIYWPTTTNGLLDRGAYNWGTDGKYYQEIPAEKEIREVDGVYYYYENGIKQIGAGVVELIDEEGATFYIYVRSNGQLATGEYWPTTTNDLLPRGKYDWGTDGKYYPAN